MALTVDETAVFNRLSSKLGLFQPEYKLLDAYYEGLHRLQTLGLAVPPDLELFVTSVNWPRVAVDSVEQRCNVEGFRLPGQDTVDDDLWRIWQANDLDEESQQGHLEAMMAKRSYIVIGSRKEGEPNQDIPLITLESPDQMIHESDPRTRELKAALRKKQAEDGSSTEYATLFFRNYTVWLERNRSSRGWVEVDRDEHNLGVVPVVPLLNRSRLKNRLGVSEMADVIPLTDAACRALTNAQLATEIMAVPQRYVLGAQPKDFVDAETGEPLTAWETYFGAVWALTNGEAKVGQFSAADLANFETIVNHYANLASGVSGLPTRFFGQYTTNPPTEGSIVADETRLIMNAYRKHRTFGGSWERAMRIARRFIDGSFNPDLMLMETIWANPETPTRAQLADAVVKLSTATVDGRPIMPLDMAREELGWSKTKRDRAKEMDENAIADAANDPVVLAARALSAPEPVAPVTVPDDAASSGS